MQVLATDMQRIRSVLLGLIICVSFCSFLSSSAHGQGDIKAEPGTVEVSLLRLIATPQEFHGKAIRVSGVFRYEFEDTALYLSQEHLKKRVKGNSIWLRIDRSFVTSNATRLRSLSGAYVVVEGIFDANAAGHFDAFPYGTLRQIKRIDAISIPRRVG